MLYPTVILTKEPSLVLPGAWVMSIAGGAVSTATESPPGTLNLFGDGTNAARGDQSFASVVGQAYRVKFAGRNGNCVVTVGTTQGGNNVLNQLTSGTGFFEYIFTASSTTSWVRLSKTTNLCIVSNITVR